MWDVPRFTEIHKYDFVITENVVDVRMWVMFEAWIKAMHSLGYKHECIYLNAMFAHNENITGFAPQSRDRIYIVFWKKGNKKPDLSIRPKAPCSRCGTVEAIQTWKNGRRAGKYKTQYIYRCSSCNIPVVPFYYAALNALDLSYPMVRIGDRESLGMKPLKPNTLNRIKFGINKFGYRPTILDQRNQHGTLNSRIRGAETDPLNAQSAGFSSYLFSPFLFNMLHTKSTTPTVRNLNDVIMTQTTKESLGLVTARPFIVPNRKTTPARELTDVLPTITGQRNSMSLIVPIHGTARPRLATVDSMDTIMTTGHSSLIMAPYHGRPQANHILEPSSTIPTRDSIALIDAKPEIEDCYFRMLQPSETARAQGFPMDYTILGNKEQRQKQIGNANPPPTMELLVSRCVESLL